MRAAQLGEHARLIRGITFKPADKCDPQVKDAIVCMRTKNVQATLDDSDLIAVPSRLIKNSEKILSQGDILVSSANSWNLVGKCCQVKELQYPSTAGAFISILRPKTEKLDSGYLYRWFSSDKIQRRVRSFGNQTTNISNLDHKRTLKLPIPFPPLAEQKRIAGILDAADALRAKRRESLAQLDTLLQSTFLDMFGDPVTNPMGWEVKALNNLCLMKSGGTPSRSNPSFFQGSIPWVTTPSLGLRYVGCNDAIELITKEAVANSATKIIPAGSILVGVRVGVGKVSIASCAICTNQDIVSLVDLSEYISVDFLRFQIAIYEKVLSSQKRGATIQGITSKSLKKLPILFPPLDLQRRFAAIVESIEQQKVSQRAHLAELNTLFASLQSRAFKGEL